jgi:RNA polymerase sigma factor (sigma-70 family)
VAVVANEARHVLRRRRTGRVTELAADPPDDVLRDPAEGIARVDLVNALHHLDADDRTLLALRYGAGLDSTQIGRCLGLSASGVRARLMRVLARLRKELADA